MTAQLPRGDDAPKLHDIAEHQHSSATTTATTRRSKNAVARRHRNNNLARVADKLCAPVLGRAECICTYLHLWLQSYS